MPGDLDLKKVDRDLAKLYNSYRAHSGVGFMSTRPPPGFVWKRREGKPPRLAVIIRCDREANLDDLVAQGVTINQPRGSVRTAYLPVDKLHVLVGSDKVEYVAASGAGQLSLNEARRAANFPHQVSEPDDNLCPTGKGVLIGFVDSGIDGQHEHFAGRILAVWDQSIKDGNGPARYKDDERMDYGVEYRGADIAEKSTDTDGHGTHVAGIACGAGKEFPGVALNAEILMVKLRNRDSEDKDYFKLWESDIVDGVAYLIETAKELNRPIVINLSLGFHIGPHDGTELLSTFITENSGPGVIVCCAAGNEGDDRIHARGRLDAIQFFPLSFDVKSGAELIRMECWVSKGLLVSIEFEPPMIVSDTADFVATNLDSIPDFKVNADEPLMHHIYGDLYEDLKVIEGDHCYHFQQLGSKYSNSAEGYLIEISHVGSLLPAREPYLGAPVRRGEWRFTVELAGQVENGNQDGDSGELVVDFWITKDPRSNRFPCEFTEGSLEADMRKVAMPGTARGAITVGSIVSRDRESVLPENRKRRFRQRSRLSSQGPLANGVDKPEVLAPGENIVSTRSKNKKLRNNYSEVTGIPAQYLALSGTSMASPFVAGVVALMLETNPELTAKEVKDLLRKSSPEFRGDGQRRLDVTDLLTTFKGYTRKSSMTP